MIVVREKHHGFAVGDAGKENPLLLWDEVTDLFRERRLDVRLVRNDLLLDQEIDEFVQPIMRHLVERGGIGGRLQRGQVAVVVLLEAQGCLCAFQLAAQQDDLFIPVVRNEVHILLIPGVVFLAHARGAGLGGRQLLQPRNEFVGRLAGGSHGRAQLRAGAGQIGVLMFG